MPTISNATVATGTGLSTAGNGGRKIVRLSNGWLVSAFKSSGGSNTLYFHKSTDNGNTWSQICYIQNGTTLDFGITNNGLKVYVILTRSDGSFAQAYNFDASTQTNVNLSSTNVLLSSESAMGNVSLAINEAGTELHAAWSSKNATYPNSFNIRYAKGVISGDGSVTWGAVEQVSVIDGSATNIKNPSIALNGSNASIFAEQEFSSANRIWLFSKSLATADLPSVTTGAWKNKRIFEIATHIQANPSALFVPTAINGLANGRLWVAWHGKDATDSAKFNVRVSYSDDGGVTWSTPTKLTTGNLYDRQNVSLAADKTGKVFALYEEHQWSPDLDIYMRTFSGGSWGAPVAVAEAEPAAESNPSALVDYSLQMTTPPFVFMSGTDGIKFSGNFNVGAAVSPASGALGNKETATLTTYTVTPEAGSTVTQIVERVNGVTVNTFNNPASLSRTLTVPTATWDTLAYFATHTASITVTDSNGATTVTTYSFDKRLATGASLLEATKANTDAKNRISQKRDALAAQVGLSAGATFDAISAQLASGVFLKVATGTFPSATANPVVTGLSFKPKIVMLWQGTSYVRLIAYSEFTNPSSFRSNNTTSDVTLDGTNHYVVQGGFGFTAVNGVDKWLAIG